MTCFYALCERGRWGGKQIGEDWRDEGAGMSTISGWEERSTDGAVKLWDIDTTKFITKWTGHTAGVISLC
jgi:hypothetical protein